MTEKKKRKYEKPVAIDTGSVASVLGNKCSNGGVATDGCVAGNDPHVAPVCQPGLTATFNCGSGTTNTNGNCTHGGDAFGACSDGSAPVGKKLFNKNSGFSR